MDTENSVSIGKELGLKAAGLRAWVEQERVRLCDERALHLVHKPLIAQLLTV